MAVVLSLSLRRAQRINLRAQIVGLLEQIRRCTVVYLECDADTVADRIARNSGRPLLAGDAMGRWTAMFATRRPVYERLADITLDVRHGSIPELGGRLEAALRNHAAAKQEVEK